MSNENEITHEDIKKLVSSEHYFSAYDGSMNSSLTPGKTGVFHGKVSVSPLANLTLCVLVLTNGSTVVGESHCIGDHDSNAEAAAAQRDAFRKILPLAQYELKTKLSQKDDE